MSQALAWWPERPSSFSFEAFVVRLVVAEFKLGRSAGVKSLVLRLFFVKAGERLAIGQHLEKTACDKRR